MAFNIQLSFSKEHAATGDISLAWSNYTFVRGGSNDFAFAFHTAPVPGMLLSRRFVFGNDEAGTIRRETVDIGFQQAMGLFLMFNGTLDGEKFSTAAFVGPVSHEDRLSLEFLEGARLSALVRHENFFKEPCVVRCPDGTSTLGGCITCQTQFRGAITVCC